MKHLALITTIIALAGCASTPEHRVAWDLGSVWMYQSDMDQYGVEDHATLPPMRGGMYWGDCEDYALLAQQRLAELGIKSTIMTGTIPAQSRMSGIIPGSAHAFVLTENGYVLDNNMRTPKRLEYYRIENPQPLK